MTSCFRFVVAPFVLPFLICVLPDTQNFVFSVHRPDRMALTM